MNIYTCNAEGKPQDMNIPPRSGDATLVSAFKYFLKNARRYPVSMSEFHCTVTPEDTMPLEDTCKASKLNRAEAGHDEMRRVGECRHGKSCRCGKRSGAPDDAGDSLVYTLNSCGECDDVSSYIETQFER